MEINFLLKGLNILKQILVQIVKYIINYVLENVFRDADEGTCEQDLSSVHFFCFSYDTVNILFDITLLQCNYLENCSNYIKYPF